VRIVPPENLHVTIAFLGSRPTSEVEPIGMRCERQSEVSTGRFSHRRRYRETRSVGMLVLDDEDGRATSIREDAHRRLASSASTSREASVASARHGRPLSRAARAQPFDPELGPMTMSDAAVYMSRLRRPGRSTKSWSQFH
jgi:2'-5' RNA ligase